MKVVTKFYDFMVVIIEKSVILICNKKERAEECVMFDNEYCNVTYVEESRAVLLTWKRFSSFDNYRKPTLYVLDLLRKHKNSNFVVDARNGFEDEKEDVEWAFHELLPNMALTDCKHVIFIMNEVNDIEGEMDMWSMEMSKYFTVSRVTSVEGAMKKLSQLEDFIWLNVIYTIKEGKRDEFYQKLVDQKIIEQSKSEHGNIVYDYYKATDCENQLLLVEAWRDEIAIKQHLASNHYIELSKLKEEYVTNVVIRKFKQY